MSTGNLDELQREFEVARGAGKWDRAAELSEQIEEIKLKQGQQSQESAPVSLHRMTRLGKVNSWQLSQIASAARGDEHITLYYSGTALWTQYESGELIETPLVK